MEESITNIFGQGVAADAAYMAPPPAHVFMVKGVATLKAFISPGDSISQVAGHGGAREQQGPSQGHRLPLCTDASEHPVSPEADSPCRFAFTRFSP